MQRCFLPLVLLLRLNYCSLILRYVLPHGSVYGLELCVLAAMVSRAFQCVLFAVAKFLGNRMLKRVRARFSRKDISRKKNKGS